MPQRIVPLIGLLIFLVGCGKPAASTGYRIYVTNERSGDLSIIDAATLEVVATVPLML